MSATSNESRRVEADESDDDYPAIIARLNAAWRVVVALDQAGWILQRQRGAHRSANDWRTRVRCKTRFAMIRCVGLYAGQVDAAALAILNELPLHIDWTKKPRRRVSARVGRPADRALPNPKTDVLGVR